MPRLEFLLDADMPRAAAGVLRSRGFAVEDIRDAGLGATSDADIIAYALRTGKVIVTRDTDFGEVLRYPRHPGAVILRLPPETRVDEVKAYLEGFLDQVKERDILDAITIIEPGRIRRRPIS